MIEHGTHSVNNKVASQDTYFYKIAMTLRFYREINSQSRVHD